MATDVGFSLAAGLEVGADDIERLAAHALGQILTAAHPCQFGEE